MPEAEQWRMSSPRVPAAYYASAVMACVATTAVAAPLSRDLDLASVVMLSSLTVLLVALRLGRGPAMLLDGTCNRLTNDFSRRKFRRV